MRNKLSVALLLGGFVALAMSGTAMAQQDRVSATEKGSLVILSKVEIRWDNAGFVLQDTFLSLTNDYPGWVNVQMYFINGDEPLEAVPGVERAHPGWNWFDQGIQLTPDQPTYWSALTGQPAQGGLAPFTALDPGFPPGRPNPDGGRMLRGYILAWAVDANNEEIRWNHLKGEGTIIDYERGRAWEYNSFNHAVVATGIAHGQQSGTPGQLNLDGVEFSPSFDQLLLNFQAVDSAAFSGPRLVVSDTDLTLFPVSVDLRQENDGPVKTKASFEVWNMNEVKFSNHDRCITCWNQELLSNYGVPNHFLIQNLQTDVGKARIDGLASQVCDTPDFPSVAAALLGVSAKMLTIDGGMDYAAAGSNLVGMGTQNALIQYDLSGPPPEAQTPELPSEVMDLLNGKLRR